MKREIVSLARVALGCRVHAIENKAAGPRLIAALAGEVPGIYAVDPDTTSKRQRAAAVVPIWAALRVWIPHPHETRETYAWQPEGYEWVRRDFLPEYLAFPLGSKDDQIDAMSQGLGGAFANEFPPAPTLTY